MRADGSRDNLLSILPENGTNGYERLGGADGTVAAAGKQQQWAWAQRAVRRLDRFFGVSARGSCMTTEVRAGCITWMTMSYILVVNPVILSHAGTPDNPLLPEPVMTATAISAGIGSLLVGLLGDAPVGIMPGMGLNAYFAFGICQSFGVSWQEALSCCFVSGALLLLLSVCGVCHWLVSTLLSDHLKKAITVAIGLFQALIGFQVMGLVVASPDTLIAMGDMSWSNQRLWLALAGFCLISAMLVQKDLHGALLIGIWVMAAMAWVLGLQAPPQGLLSMPKLSAALVVDFSGWVPGSGKLPGMLAGSAVMLFVALFDLAGVQYGLFSIAGLLKDGSVPRSTSIFSSTALGTMIGALLGTSPVIIANESSAGIVEGARTGLAAIVVAVLFFFSAFMGPLLSAIPHVATAVPLVLIGAFMMAPCCGIDWDDLRVAIPSFLTMTVVPFTYSIHTGIIAGILMDAFLSFAAKCGGLKGETSTVAASLEKDKRATPRLEKRLSSPHITMASTPRRSDKVDRVRLLLADLGPRCALNAEDAVESSRDEALLRALETYLEGR